MNNQILCECGIKVKGTTKIHAESLMPEHRKSKKHKERMELIKKIREEK